MRRNCEKLRSILIEHFANGGVHYTFEMSVGRWEKALVSAREGLIWLSGVQYVQFFLLLFPEQQQVHHHRVDRREVCFSK